MAQEVRQTPPPRVYAERLQAILKTPVIVENKPGAYEQIAAQAVLASPPDGYTLWWGTTGALTMGPGIRTDIPYDVVKASPRLARSPRSRPCLR